VNAKFVLAKFLEGGEAASMLPLYFPADRLRERLDEADVLVCR
jgi:hypothetical protein